MIKEFREFILRGSVIDLAVAVVIGAAFSAIIKSLVDDIIMPLIGILLGGVDFTSLTVQVGSATVMYGNFIQAVINFLLIGLALFFVVKAINSMHKRLDKKEEQPAEPEGPSEEIQLLREIRDLLKQQK